MPPLVTFPRDTESKLYSNCNAELAGNFFTDEKHFGFNLKTLRKTWHKTSSNGLSDYHSLSEIPTRATLLRSRESRAGFVQFFFGGWVHGSVQYTSKDHYMFRQLFFQEIANTGANLDCETSVPTFLSFEFSFFSRSLCAYKTF